MKKLLDIAIKELEFCVGTAPFCDEKRINKTLNLLKKSLTSPKKVARINSGKNILKELENGKRSCQSRRSKKLCEPTGR